MKSMIKLWCVLGLLAGSAYGQSFTVSPESVELSSIRATNNTFVITSVPAVTVGVSWVAVDWLHGMPTGTIALADSTAVTNSYIVSRNRGTNSRTATITFYNTADTNETDSLVITQRKADVVAFMPATTNMPGVATSFKIYVTNTAAATLISTSSWITSVSTTSYDVGITEIYIGIPINPHVRSRTGTIAIGSTVTSLFTFTQAPLNLEYEVTPSDSVMQAFGKVQSNIVALTYDWSNLGDPTTFINAGTSESEDGTTWWFSPDNSRVDFYIPTYFMAPVHLTNVATPTVFASNITVGGAVGLVISSNRISPTDAAFAPHLTISAGNRTNASGTGGTLSLMGGTNTDGRRENVVIHGNLVAVTAIISSVRAQVGNPSSQAPSLVIGGGPASSQGDAEAGSVDVVTDMTTRGHVTIASNLTVDGHATIASNLVIAAGGTVKLNNHEITSWGDIVGNWSEYAATQPVNVAGWAITNASVIHAELGAFIEFDGDSELVFNGNSAILNDTGTNVWKGRVNAIEASRIVAGTVRTDDHVALSSNLTVGGHATVASNLNVGGHATVASNLNVGGHVTITSNLTVGGHVTITSNLTVGGHATITSNLTVAGTTALTSNLTVAGTTALTSNLTVGGTTTITSNLTVAGTTTLTSNLTVGGHATVASNLTVSGMATVASAKRTSTDPFGPTEFVTQSHVDALFNSMMYSHVLYVTTNWVLTTITNGIPSGRMTNTVATNADYITNTPLWSLEAVGRTNLPYGTTFTFSPTLQRSNEFGNVHVRAHAIVRDGSSTNILGTSLPHLLVPNTEEKAYTFNIVVTNDVSFAVTATSGVQLAYSNSGSPQAVFVHHGGGKSALRFMANVRDAPELFGWSAYQAQHNVDMSGFAITNVHGLTLTDHVNMGGRDITNAAVIRSTYISPSTTSYGIRWEGEAGIHNKFGEDGIIFAASPYNSSAWYTMSTRTQQWWGVGETAISNAFWISKDGVHMTNPYRINATNLDIGVLQSGLSMRLTTGLTITATTVSGWTNSITAAGRGQHLSLVAGAGTYPTVKGGHLLLTPGTDGPANSRVKVTHGIFEADEIKAVKMGLAQVGAPGSEVLSAWLQSDGTNLFFVSTVGTGFTNALTANTYP